MSKKLSSIIKENSLATYHYCTKNGKVGSDFPTNPNGSIDNIAALGNLPGNAMAIMPHPERTIGGEGDAVFKAMNKYIMQENSYSYRALKYAAEKIAILPFEKSPTTKEIIISMIITDNEASSVEKCVQKLGANTTIKRYVHFEIEADKNMDLKDVYKTDVLFNPSKEFMIELDNTNETKRFLVREKENIEGRRIKEILQKRFGFDKIKNVQKGVVWEIGSKKNQLKKDVNLIINSHILSNPISQVCHEY
jgi:phosphoribosylformylglycinamidine synthase